MPPPALGDSYVKRADSGQKYPLSPLLTASDFSSVVFCRFEGGGDGGNEDAAEFIVTAILFEGADKLFWSDLRASKLLLSFSGRIILNVRSVVPVATILSLSSASVSVSGLFHVRWRVDLKKSSPESEIHSHEIVDREVLFIYYFTSYCCNCFNRKKRCMLSSASMATCCKREEHLKISILGLLDDISHFATFVFP
eukprot:scaffold9722_cov75-Skeletonema_dohrnii-CCMP3373.AAC.3